MTKLTESLAEGFQSQQNEKKEQADEVKPFRGIRANKFQRKAEGILSDINSSESGIATEEQQKQLQGLRALSDKAAKRQQNRELRQQERGKVLNDKREAYVLKQINSGAYDFDINNPEERKLAEADARNRYNTLRGIKKVKDLENNFFSPTIEEKVSENTKDEELANTNIASLEDNAKVAPSNLVDFSSSANIVTKLS